MGDDEDILQNINKVDFVVFRRELLRWIIMDELSFRTVDSKNLRRFMSFATHKFSVPSRRTVTRDCFAFYDERKRKLKKLLNENASRFSFTTDTWTSVQRINYMCLTAHWIDDNWKLQKMILNFCHIDSHMGEAIGKSIELCLFDWGLKDVFAITVDNASSKDGAVAHIKKRCISWGTDIHGGQLMHNKCVAHVMDLVVGNGLKKLQRSLRKPFICMHRGGFLFGIELSTPLLPEDEDIVDMDEITGDIANVGVPTTHDWDTVRRLYVMLKVFFGFTTRVSGSLYVTSNSYLDDVAEVHSTLKEWSRSKDVDTGLMETRITLKYDKYFGNMETVNPIIFIVTVLDPWCKMKYVEHYVVKMYGLGPHKGRKLMKNVKEVLEALFNEYKTKHQGENTPSASTSPVNIDADQDWVRGEGQMVNIDENLEDIDQIDEEWMQKASSSANAIFDNNELIRGLLGL